MKPDDTIIIDQDLHASSERVWKAWTEADYVRQWFGSDPNGKVLQAALDVRIGGAFEVTFRNSSGVEEYTCFGIYTSIQPFHNLQFTWAWRNEPGVESRVSITLHAAGDITQMHFVHEGVGTTSAHNYNEGWRSTFKKLDRMLLKEH